jgi:hypothetical protein
MAKTKRPPIALADSALLRDPKFTRQFLVGAEFEAYVRPASAGRQATQEQARDEILRLLDAVRPGYDWTSRLSFVDDASLEREKPSEYGLEIVLAHAPGPQALAEIGDILKALSNSDGIRTDSTCGFHLNASFANPRHNSSAVLARVSDFVPTTALLRLFRRAANEYCPDNALMGFDIGEIMEESDIASALSKAAGLRAPRNDWTLADLDARLQALRKPKTLAAFAEIVLARAREKILYQCDCERPACAPRIRHISKPAREPSSSNYMEFRMMGGANYPRRPLDLAAGIQACLAGMVQAARAESAKTAVIAPGSGPGRVAMLP